MEKKSPGPLLVGNENEALLNDSWRCEWEAPAKMVCSTCWLVNYIMVGGLEHVLFSIIYGIILPNWLIFFRGVETTNQHCIPLIDRISGHFLKMPQFLGNLIDTRSFDAGCIVASSNVWVVVLHLLATDILQNRTGNQIQLGLNLNLILL